MRTPSESSEDTEGTEGTVPGESVEADRAVCRSVLYAALASALRPPTRKNLERLWRDEDARVLVSAAAFLSRQGHGDELAEITETLIERARSAELPELGLSFQRLFGHTARGKVPPYDTEYGSGGGPFGQTRELVDINGFYRAFGLAVDEGKNERSDHVSAECEFLSFLTCKESVLSSGTDEVALAEVRKAERLFLRDHLGRFGRAFARSLSAESDHPFYRTVGELGFAFWTAECEHLDVALGPEVVPLRAEEEIEVPMACEATCPLAESSPATADPS